MPLAVEAVNGRSPINVLGHTLIYSEEDILCVVVGLMSIALRRDYLVVTSLDASMRHRQPCDGV
eukprot:scaffold18777_cov173-Skeletonema_menzelii.AAC.2